MFDQVGKNDSETTKRQLSSLLASLAINGAVLGFLVYLGNQVVSEDIEDVPVEVTFFDAAPPPPPYVGRRGFFCHPSHSLL